MRPYYSLSESLRDKNGPGISGNEFWWYGNFSKHKDNDLVFFALHVFLQKENYEFCNESILLELC